MKATCGTCREPTIGTPTRVAVFHLLTLAEEGSTWYGCGQHVPSVLDSVPETARCICQPKVERDGKQYPPQGKSIDVSLPHRDLRLMVEWLGGALGFVKAALGFGGTPTGGKEEL